MDYKAKKIITTLYLKDGEVMEGYKNHNPVSDPETRIQAYNDSGLDQIILFDLSEGEDEHEENLHLMKRITRIAEIPVYAGGNVNSLEDIKKILYAGCSKVILNQKKNITAELIAEAAPRFGRERLALSVFNVDVFFKERSRLNESVSEIVALEEALGGTLGSVTDMPYVILMRGLDREKIADLLRTDETICGVSVDSIDTQTDDIPALKRYLEERGVHTGHLHALCSWSEVRTDERGLVPVIAQDHRTSEVLMLAYMNEEAFYRTLALGKMTYYSRSRSALWTKGESSGHFQYVKSLSLDCDRDTILARVSQVGPACHSGNHSCFFTDLVCGGERTSNPAEVLEREYGIIVDRRINPKEGSYTNYLFDKGIDKILKKIGEEASEIVIAAKNPDREEIKYEIADFLYHLMVMMVEKNITWDEILDELSRR